MFRENLNTPEIEFFLRVWNNHQASFYFHNAYLIKYRIHFQSATSSGLSIHNLFLWLKDIAVSENNKKYKINFLNRLSVPAMNSFLREGDLKKAKLVYYSEFYKDVSFLNYKSTIQKIILLFPFIRKYI
ncbi:hypothetical protein [Pedobacter sp. SL55]|uniref:hypothetical protein n=1 Tax=Pedobacter sp. SL55 TaxID=2995161 RepID=UPI002271EDF0|nr:hypothetical protein [Pedobacter sp. SL55]WAC39055.1 hypothetical protein OVA16_10555 [Pedobacter sp. SL55]